MANEHLKRLLEINKRADQITEGGKASKGSKNPYSVRTMSESQLTEKINEWDQLVYGPSEPVEEDTERYSAEAEMEKLKNLPFGSVQTNNPILQEVINNPYIMDPSFVESVDNTRMQALEEKIRNSKAVKGLNAVKKINDTLNEEDQKKKQQLIQETRVVQAGTTGTIDYSLIKTIVESVINEKLGELKKSMLNESVNHFNPAKTTMIMLDKNFTFVDANGKMYTCEGIKYKGKLNINKKSKQ